MPKTKALLDSEVDRDRIPVGSLEDYKRFLFGFIERGIMDQEQTWDRLSVMQKASIFSAAKAIEAYGNNSGFPLSYDNLVKVVKRNKALKIPTEYGVGQDAFLNSFGPIWEWGIVHVRSLVANAESMVTRKKREKPITYQIDWTKVPSSIPDIWTYDDYLAGRVPPAQRTPSVKLGPKKTTLMIDLGDEDVDKIKFVAMKNNAGKRKVVD